MVKTEFEKFTDLEQKFTNLEQKVNAMGKVKPVKDKKPRKPSEYNIFMKKFLTDDKKKNPDRTHAERFTEGAKAWGLKEKS